MVNHPHLSFGLGKGDFRRVGVVLGDKKVEHVQVAIVALVGCVGSRRRLLILRRCRSSRCMHGGFGVVNVRHFLDVRCPMMIVTVWLRVLFRLVLALSLVLRRFLFI